MACLDDPGRRNRLVIVLAVGLLLTVILVPLSFSYVEYYQYGLVQRKSTGTVDTTEVYGQGRYNLGPDYRFILYQADAHVEEMKNVSVFSAGTSNFSVGLAFKLDVVFTYLLKGDEVGLLHKDFSTSYRDNVLGRTKEAIKNYAAVSVTYEDQYQRREQVEQRLRVAVQESWDTEPTLHATLDQFLLGRIQIPEDVAQMQVKSKIQNERNEQEKFLQEAQVERGVTAVEVNEKVLKAESLLRSKKAEANLIVAKAKVQAQKVLQDAQSNGTSMLIKALGILTQEELTTFTYIWSLKNRKDVDISLNYLQNDNVVKTQQVA